MKNDIVPYSLILRGWERRNKEQNELMEFECKQQEAEEERQNEENEKRRLTQEYGALYEKLIADAHINSILNEGKILTGDDVRQGDILRQVLVPPVGFNMLKA